MLITGKKLLLNSFPEKKMNFRIHLIGLNVRLFLLDVQILEECLQHPYK